MTRGAALATACIGLETDYNPDAVGLCVAAGLFRN